MENHFTNIKSLIGKTKDKIGKPVSSQVVAATIESLGIREKDTFPDFGFNSIQELSDLIYFELTNDEYYTGIKNIKELEVERTQPKVVQFSDFLWIKTKIFAQYYSLGIFHLLPIFIQIAAIVFFGYSLWTYVGFNEIQSTSVVLGVIIGLVATGGFVQVIGRQASFYWNYDDYKMTEKTINYLLRLGALSIFGFLASIFIINSFFHIYPYEILLVSFIYAFLIGILLLILAPLHTIKQRWMITVSILIGTVVAIYLKENTVLIIYVTHWIGIAIAIIITKIYLFLYFKRLNKGKKLISGSNIRVQYSVIYKIYRYWPKNN